MTELKPAPVIKVALRDNQNTQQQSKEEAHQAKTAGLNEVVVTSNPKFKNRQEAENGLHMEA